MKQKILLPVLVLSALFLLGPTGDTVYEGATEGGGGGGTATSLSLSPAPALCTTPEFSRGITANGDASCDPIAEGELPASVKLDTEAPYWTSHATNADPNTLPEDCDDPMSLYTYTNSGAGPNTHWACTVASTNTWEKIALEGVTNVEDLATGGAAGTAPVSDGAGGLTMKLGRTTKIKWTMSGSTGDCYTMVPNNEMSAVSPCQGAPTLNIEGVRYTMAFTNVVTFEKAVCWCSTNWTGDDNGDTLNFKVQVWNSSGGSKSTLKSVAIPHTDLQACPSTGAYTFTVDLEDTATGSAGFYGIDLEDGTDTGTALQKERLACWIYTREAL